MECGKRADPSKDGLAGMSVVQLREKVQTLYPFIANPKSLSRKVLCDLINKDCASLGGLINKQNSCYLDSTLIALFHNMSPYFITNVFEKKLDYNSNQKLQAIAEAIQQSLHMVFTSVINGKCGALSRLRKGFQAFDHYYSRTLFRTEHLDWEHAQLEPADVVKILIRMFQIPNDCKYKFESYGYAKRKKYLVTSEIRETNIADIIISADDIYSKNSYDMKSELLPQHKTRATFDADNLWKPSENAAYNKQQIIKTYLKAPMLIIQVARVFAGKKIKTAVVPILNIKLKENTKKLYLTSIICHHGSNVNHGHYTCYIVCKNDWYHYDDIGFQKMKLIGDVQTLFKHNDNFVLRNAVNFIYI